MHVPMLRQTGACCHGAAMLHKRSMGAYSAKVDAGLAIRIRAKHNVRCVN
jgi:hypothetical protein